MANEDIEERLKATNEKIDQLEKIIEAFIQHPDFDYLERIIRSFHILPDYQKNWLTRQAELKAGQASFEYQGYKPYTWTDVRNFIDKCKKKEQSKKDK